MRTIDRIVVENVSLRRRIKHAPAAIAMTARGGITVPRSPKATTNNVELKIT